MSNRPILQWRKPAGVAALAAAALALAVPRALPQTPQAEAGHDALYVQAMRAKHLAEMKAKVYYTGKRFDVDTLPSYTAEQQVSGTIRIWGLNYLGDCMLAQYWKDGFEKLQPGARIEYTLPTALTSTSGLVAGTCDIGANRRITFTELLQFERVYNHDPLEIPLATGSLDVMGWSDAMTILVHRTNPITRLTLRQLDGIYGAARLGGWSGTTWHPEFARGDAENIRTWGQLGLTGEWAGRQIHPYGAVIRFDTSTKFSDAVLHSSDKWNENVRMYANYANPDGTTMGWEVGMAKDMSGDPCAIGYDGIECITPELKAPAIESSDGKGFVEPTVESLQSRAYPLWQGNYWYINRAPGAPVDPKVREFLRYTLSREGQEQVIRDGKYLPLNAKLVADALKSLE